MTEQLEDLAPKLESAADEVNAKLALLQADKARRAPTTPLEAAEKCETASRIGIAYAAPLLAITVC